MEKLILSFDTGTQSVRAMLYNDKGQLIDKVKSTFEPYFSTEEGYAEQHADLYFDKICEASQALKKRNADIWDAIIGVAVTAMRDVGVCLDKDLKPLRPAIIWLDRRRAACNFKLPLKTKVVFAISGMKAVIEKNMKDCKSNWIAENEKEIWEKTYKYVQLSTYINMRFTGEIKESVASNIGHIPMNYRGRKWMGKGHFQYPIFSVPTEKMYPLCEPGETIGYVTEEAERLTGVKKGIPYVATGSDKGCETIGIGAIYDDIGSLSFGTTATIQITTKKYVEPITFLPAYPAVYPGRFNSEIMINRGYWMLTWFIDEFIRKEGEDKAVCYEKMLDKRLNEVEPGCEGLYVEPYWGGALKQPEGRGAIVGFTDKHTRIHLYRAMIEGINYALMVGKEGLEKKSKKKLTKLGVSGGGAQSDEVCQITADMFGLPVYRVQTYETSGLGAALCAFVGLKHFSSYDEAIKSMVHHEKTFEPNLKNTAIYKVLYENIYKKSYKRLKPLFISLKKKVKED